MPSAWKFGNVEVSISTRRRRFSDFQPYGRRPAKKPFVSKKNQKARLRSACERRNWAPQEWAKVPRSDESKFPLFCADDIQYVRRPVNPRYQIPTTKRGAGSAIAWERFSRDGSGPLCQIEGTTDGIQCNLRASTRRRKDGHGTGLTRRRPEARLRLF